MANFKLSKNLQNNVIVVGLITILIVVVFGVSQVVLRNLRGDRANANVGSTYLTQIGISTAEPNSNGAFDDSRKICQSLDGACVDDGLIDYSFDTLVEKTGIVAVDGGGLILDKNNDLFVQNGTITSKNYVPKSGRNVNITKIQVGVGLKAENLISMGYSVDSGANFTTAIGNYTFDQLKSQENQAVIEYNFPTPVAITQGFAYKIALKADNAQKKSPSLKFVRIFYTSTATNSSSTSGSTTSSSTSSSSGQTSSGNPTDYTTTRISARNIGNGTCTPSTIMVGGSTSCTWNLVDGPAGTVYYINTLPNETPVTGSTNLIGALVHTEASSPSLTSLGGVKTPSEISNYQTDFISSGICTVSFDKLTCNDIYANGNLTAGNKFVDIVFQGSTPPIPGVNEFYGSPAISLNKATVSLTPNNSSSSTSGSTTSTSGSTSSSSSSSGSTSSTSGSTTSGSTTSTSTSGTPFLPLPSSSSSGTLSNP